MMMITRGPGATHLEWVQLSSALCQTVCRYHFQYFAFCGIIIPKNGDSSSDKMETKLKMVYWVGGDHRSKYREDVIVPGRQGIDPVFQERRHHLWHRSTLDV